MFLPCSSPLQTTLRLVLSILGLLSFCLDGWSYLACLTWRCCQTSKSSLHLRRLGTNNVVCSEHIIRLRREPHGQSFRDSFQSLFLLIPSASRVAEGWGTLNYKPPTTEFFSCWGRLFEREIGPAGVYIFLRYLCRKTTYPPGSGNAEPGVYHEKYTKRRPKRIHQQGRKKLRDRRFLLSRHLYRSAIIGGFAWLWGERAEGARDGRGLLSTWIVATFPDVDVNIIRVCGLCNGYSQASIYWWPICG